MYTHSQSRVQTVYKYEGLSIISISNYNKTKCET